MEQGKETKGAGVSGSPPAPPGSLPQPGEAADPSMEDILASIRRILSEDEAAAPAAPRLNRPPIQHEANPIAVALRTKPSSAQPTSSKAPSPGATAAAAKALAPDMRP